MSSKYFWYNLIEVARKNDIIVDGLTIPFLLGAKKQLDPTFIIDDESVGRLLIEIANSETAEKAVLKYSPNKQYIITLRDTNFCNENLSGGLVFKNKKGSNALYVTKNVSLFGDTIKKIGKFLNEEYKKQLERQTYSWDENARRWLEFSEAEKVIINNAAK